MLALRRGRFALVLIALCAGCAPPSSSNVASVAPGSQSELRIVSLAPHLTELVYSAGLQDHLAGVVEYSDYPPEASELPRIGDAFAVDYERLTQLSPTLILAWEGGNPASVIQTLRERGFRVEALSAGRLDDVAANLRRIGALGGRAEVANAAANLYERGLADLAARYADARPLRVFFQIADQPVYTVGPEHSISNVLSICGGRNVFGELDALAATVSDEAVVAADAEVMMTSGGRDALDRWLRFEGRAVRADTLYGISADAITRDSLRLLDGARDVCAALDDARRKLAPATR